MSNLVSEPARSVLQALDGVYDSGDMRLAEELDAGERGDTLADYIQFEIVQTTSHLAPGEEKEAALEAMRSLSAARISLAEVSLALSKLLASASVDEALESADKAYHNGEALLTEDLPLGERGDTLADFIRMEILDVATGASRPALEAYQAMGVAIKELDDCLYELDQMLKPSSKPRP